MNYISEDDLKQMNKWVDEWNLLERNRISPSTIIIFNASKVGAAARYEELEAQFTKFIKDEYDSDFDIENFQEFVRNNSLEEDKDIDKLKEHFKRFM